MVKVVYDPERISYADLLRVFWVNIDPFDAAGQFCDKGASYRAAIFYAMPEQKDLAEQSKIIVEKEILKRAVVTPVEPVSAFYPAEGYHQDYYKTNALKYKFYRWNCGRDARLAEVWEKQDITPLKRLD